MSKNTMSSYRVGDLVIVDKDAFATREIGWKGYVTEIDGSESSQIRVRILGGPGHGQEPWYEPTSLTILYEHTSEVAALQAEIDRLNKVLGDIRKALDNV